MVFQLRNVEECCSEMVLSNLLDSVTSKSQFKQLNHLSGLKSS